eukprot:TRINITY_DN29096_c0_g2_i1.p2 TRINITY_DN29096_c0_g2~~TRINITY_DN29096_c0_g2_i1.p2  ORF type:complete len:153 (+),score=30.47 TRINITY_DN29096_c0_g2_i1:278-736(+)
MSAATDKTIAAAGRAFDLAMNTFRSLHPDAAEERIMQERLMAVANENQVLGWKRCAGKVSVPHTAIVSSGSDACSVATELLHVSDYLLSLTKKLASATGDERFHKMGMAIYYGALKIADSSDAQDDGAFRRTFHPMELTDEAIEKHCRRSHQ